MLSSLFFFLVVPPLPSDRRNVIKNFHFNWCLSAGWLTRRGERFKVSLVADELLSEHKKVVQTLHMQIFSLDLFSYILWCFHLRENFKSIDNFLRLPSSLTSPTTGGQKMRKHKKRMKICSSTIGWFLKYCRQFILKCIAGDYCELRHELRKVVKIKFWDTWAVQEQRISFCVTSLAVES